MGTADQMQRFGFGPDFTAFWHLSPADERIFSRARNGGA